MTYDEASELKFGDILSNSYYPTAKYKLTFIKKHPRGYDLILGTNEDIGIPASVFNDSDMIIKYKYYHFYAPKWITEVISHQEDMLLI